MKKKEVNKLKSGVYWLYWKEGGRSLAAVGITSKGNRWMAPTNWTTVSTERKHWKAVETVKSLIKADLIE